MQTKHFIYTLLALFTSVATWAQFEFVAQVSRQSIGVNQRIEVRFTTTERVDSFKRPSFEGFNVVGGPMQSENYIWVNGQSRNEYSYSFFLEPQKKGTLIIGPAVAEYDGKQYQTESIAIEVGEAVQEQQRQQQRRRDPFARFYEEMEENFNRRRRDQLEMQQNLGEGIHLIVSVSKNNVYVNEPFTVEYGLYFSYRSGFNSLNVKSLPKYADFWNHTVEQKEMQVQEALLDGKRFRYIPLQKAILLPQKDGTLRIDPLEMEIEEQYYTGRVDVFGIPEIGVRKKVYSSGVKTIKVKPLPLENRPENFSGAVGSYKFSVTTDRTEVNANETLKLNVNVEGKGNLELMSLPKPIVPSALELYEPEKINRVTKNMSSGMQGTKTEQYVIVPQFKGSYTIDPLSFSYFDLASETYKTITTDSIVIDVIEGPEMSDGEIVSDEVEIVDRNEIQPLDRNIEWFNGKFVTQNTNFYILWLGSLLLLPVMFFVRKQSHKKGQDIEGRRLKVINKLAKKYLSEARSKIGDKEAFYEALERCLHNYLKARLKIETSDMSNENITDLLNEHQVNESDIATFIQIKTTCEMARYAQMNIQTMQNDFDLAATLIQSIDKQLKK